MCKPTTLSKLRVTQERWDPQDLKERTERGYDDMSSNFQRFSSKFASLHNQHLCVIAVSFYLSREMMETLDPEVSQVNQ